MGPDSFIARMGGEAIRELLEKRRPLSARRRPQREAPQNKVDASADETRKTAQNRRRLYLVSEQSRLDGHVMRSRHPA